MRSAQIRRNETRAISDALVHFTRPPFDMVLSSAPERFGNTFNSYEKKANAMKPMIPIFRDDVNDWIGLFVVSSMYIRATIKTVDARSARYGMHNWIDRRNIL